MVIFIYFLLCILIMNYCAKNSLDLPSENTMIILAILVAGEVNFWKRR